MLKNKHIGLHQKKGSFSRQFSRPFLQGELTVSDLKRLNDYDKISRRYGKLVNSFYLQVKFGANLEEAKDSFFETAKYHFSEAFKQGKGLAHNVLTLDKIQLTESDLEFIEGAAQREAEYFGKFLQDVVDFEDGVDPDGVRKLMPFANRAELYQKTLDSMVYAGAVASLHPDTIVWWELSPHCIHCEGCLALSAANPWTVSTLPTTPRAGGTPCLSNCQCHLRFGNRLDVGEAPTNAPRSPSTVRTFDGKPANIDRPIESQISDFSSSMNYHRQAALAVMDGKPYGECSKEVKELVDYHLSERKRINKAIIELQDRLNVKVIPTYSVGELEASVNDMLAAGKKFVEDPAMLPIGQTVYTLSNTFLDAGPIKEKLARCVLLESAVRGDVVLFFERSLFFTDSMEAASAVESKLRSLPIVSKTELNPGTHVSDAYKVTFEDGSFGVFKPASGEYGGLDYFVTKGHQYKHEIAAYELDKLLGLDVVPETVERTLPDLGVGSMMRWVKNKRPFHEMHRWDIIYSESARKVSFFDALSGQPDRHNANFMIDSTFKEVSPIDHGYSFTKDIKAFDLNSHLSYPGWKVDCIKDGLDKKLYTKSFASGLKTKLLDSGLLNKEQFKNTVIRIIELPDFLNSDVTPHIWTHEIDQKHGWKSLDQIWKLYEGMLK
jgi:hypothetical protein